MKIIPTFTVGLERLFSSFPLLINICSLYYKEIVKKEIKLGEISSHERVLCIGGGSVPCTALEIAKRTGAKVQVVDIDPTAVENAKKVVKRLGMESQIDVKLASGQQIDTSSFNVIHVALQAQPHEEILENVWKKAPCGTRVLIRSPKDCLRKFYTALSRDYSCINCKSIEQKYCTMKETLLFTKTEGGLDYEKDGYGAGSLSYSSVNSMVG
ncbi:SAM-dependent methyltransferase [Alkaliphilus transvaalensis]|uniref:SAM-dependent methyltransferase n=1 Tax=Alkaliphilus transvaalensis TaxID=114628 RepID=UPI000479C57C|nr:class I SAM-dependent methyltransferase [Alkaliphilus transvaalensis]